MFSSLLSKKKEKKKRKPTEENLSSENYVSRSKLWANGKMTICPFDTPILNIRSGILYI